MSELAPHFSLLADLPKEASSEGRRELLRRVTEAISQNQKIDGDDTLTALDTLLASVAADYSLAVKAELAQLVSVTHHFGLTAEQFALDDIAVAGPILVRSRVVSDSTLLKVIAKNSEPHMLAVTQRQEISPSVSYALVKSGSDEVVVALLSNTGAQIGQEGFEHVAQRAESSGVLQGPLVRRQDVPIELLNELYTKVESGLRREILRKFDSVPSEEIDKAFQRSRHRVSRRASGLPEDYEAARKRIEEMARVAALPPAALVSLLREGKAARTAFVVALARFADVEFEFVYRAVVARDMDTIALLSRGSNFERALYVTLAIGLKSTDERIGPSAEDLGRIYENVPVVAAQRAIRFWKVRAAA